MGSIPTSSKNVKYSRRPRPLKSSPQLVSTTGWPEMLCTQCSHIPNRPCDPVYPRGSRQSHSIANVYRKIGPIFDVVFIAIRTECSTTYLLQAHQSPRKHVSVLRLKQIHVRYCCRPGNGRRWASLQPRSIDTVQRWLTRSPFTCRTSAMSIRIPFGLSLYVGGNNENMAKFTISPAASEPLMVTKKLLFVFDAELEGVSVRKTFAHDVCEPSMVVEFEAKTSPVSDSRPTVRVPEYEDSDGKR